MVRDRDYHTMYIGEIVAAYEAVTPVRRKAKSISLEAMFL